MPKRTYQIKNSYSPDLLFDLVSDIESYPEFLPWVVAARIIDRHENIITAELIVKYKFFRSSYTSKVTLIPRSEIIVELIEGPFKYLNNYWKFSRDSVDFMLDFELKSKLLEDLISSEFDHYAEKMMEAFDKRATASSKLT